MSVLLSLNREPPPWSVSVQRFAVGSSLRTVGLWCWSGKLRPAPALHSDSTRIRSDPQPPTPIPEDPMRHPRREPGPLGQRGVAVAEGDRAEPQRERAL